MRSPGNEWEEEEEEEEELLLSSIMIIYWEAEPTDESHCSRNEGRKALGNFNLTQQLCLWQREGELGGGELIP